MIYLFYGNDFDKTRARRDSFLEQLLIKKPNAVFFEYDSENFKQVDIDEMFRGQGLFEREYVITLRETLALPEAKEFILENIEAFAQSRNVFVFIERKLDAPSIKIFTKHAKKIWKSDSAKNIQQKIFSPFALGDAFGGRDRKKTWALFCRARDEEGMNIELIHGILFSQIKNMLLAKNNGDENPGTHPFVFQKARHFAENYSKKELEELSSAFVALYHDARRGTCDMRIAIEQLILRI